LDELSLPSAIENSQRVLVAGAGGGFDVYAGLPIYERLRLLGKKVYLANLSFVSLGARSLQRNTRGFGSLPSLSGLGRRLPTFPLRLSTRVRPSIFFC
jgi:hypothetical protein